MKTKIPFLLAFVLLVLIQLFVPAKMIWDREDVLLTGNEFKFVTAPIDPNDPFRGKYITLQFEENTITLSEDGEWLRGESIFVSVEHDSLGFARVHAISKTEPTNDENYIEANVLYVTGNQPRELIFEYPFDRYYMEESKANDAEVVYRNSQRDTSKITYALVRIKNGSAVLQDVLIDGRSIKDLVKANPDEIK